MTSATVQTDQTATPTTTKRPSRATKAADKTAGKPAAKTTKSTTKAKATKPAEPKGPTSTEQKQAVASEIVKIVAEHLSAHQVDGASKADALAWAGQWMQYLPGARQGKIAWDKRLGAISGAGAKKSEDE